MTEPKAHMREAVDPAPAEDVELQLVRERPSRIWRRPTATP